MKFIKKFFAFLLLVIIFTTACGKQVKNEEENLDTKVSVDLDGYECVIYVDRPSTENFFGYKLDTINYEIILKRISDLEESYNCTITIDNQGTYGELSNNFVIGNLSVGENIGDIFYIAGNNYLSNLAYGGYLTPLTELKHIIDYEDSKKYGSPAVLECAMHESIPYAVQPSYWLNYQEAASFFIAFNRNLISSLGLYNPQEHLEKKDWTWETFENVLTEFYIPNGEESLPTLSAPQRAMVQLSLYSNDVRFADYIDGQLKTDIYSDKCIAAVNWVQRLYNEYAPEIITPKAGDGYWDVTKFVNQEVLMDIISGGEAANGNVQYLAEFLFGLMPFPSGPDCEYGRWAHYFEGIAGFSVPLNAEEPENAAHIISGLFEPFEEFGGTDGLFDYYNRNVFSDPLDTDIFLNAGKYARYIYWPVGGLDFTNNISTNLKAKTAAQLIETYGPSYEKIIEEYIMPNFDYLYEHMYK